MRLLLSILWRKERPASCNRPALTQPHPHLVHRNGKPRSASQAPGGVGRDGENESAPERRPFAGETGNGDVAPEGNAPGLRSRARSRPAAAPGPERAARRGVG